MKVACYVRVSTIEQAKEGYSIGEQTARLTKYCESMNWTVYKVYTDAGFTGKNTDRPALQQMISDIKRFDKVVVYKLDRLSRSQKDTLTLIEDVFLANNVDFVSMNENFDTSTPFGRFMVGILSTFAQLEREQIKERMIMGKSARAKDGKWHGGIAPTGYNYIDGQLVIDEYVAGQIKEIYQRFIEGEPLRTIENDFIKRGITHNGTYWKPTHMRRCMSNKVYLGYISNNGDIAKGQHEPIIDEDTFELANKLLKERHDQFIQSGLKTGVGANTTLLGGLIWCKHCGARYGKAKSGSKRYNVFDVYKCYSRHKKVKSMIRNPNCKNKTYRVKELDDIILNEIKKLSVDPETIHEMISEKKEPQMDIKLMQKEVDKINSQIERYLKLYSIGNYDVEQLDGLVLPLEEQKNRINEEIKSFETTTELSEDDAVDIVASFDEIIGRNDFHEIKSIIEALIDHIVIDNDDIEIYWKFL